MHAAILIATLLAGTDLGSVQHPCPETLTGKIVGGHAFIGPRIPSTAGLEIHDEARAPINQKLGEFLSEDIKNKTSLGNAYCSALAGWVEKVPGTCDAGGPPPICPVDHWYRDPSALVAWGHRNAKVASERRTTLVRLGCAPHVEAAETAIESAYSAEGDTFATCGEGQACPAGLRCAKSKCVAPTFLRGSGPEAVKADVRKLRAHAGAHLEALRDVSISAAAESPPPNRQTFSDVKNRAGWFLGRIDSLVGIIAAAEKAAGETKSDDRLAVLRKEFEAWQSEAAGELEMLKSSAVSMNDTSPFTELECTEEVAVRVEDVIDGFDTATRISWQQIVGSGSGSGSGTATSIDTAYRCSWTAGVAICWRQKDYFIHLKLENRNGYPVRVSFEPVFWAGTRKADPSTPTLLCLDTHEMRTSERAQGTFAAYTPFPSGVRVTSMIVTAPLVEKNVRGGCW